MTQQTAVSTRWEERFRVPRTIWVRLAAQRPERGLLASNATGVFQLHRWRVDSGATDPITTDPTGKYVGWLSPDGRWVAWHADRDGNELGHFVAAPWEGGEPIDLTPHLPLYTSFTGDFAADGAFAAATVGPEGGSLIVVSLDPNGPVGEPVVLDPGPGFVTQLALSRATPDGSRRLAYATTGETGLATTLRIVDAATGDILDEIAHQGATVTPVAWSPTEPIRLLASTTASGALRPIVIDADGAVHAYPMPEVAGDLLPVALSEDRTWALLLGSNRATERLHWLDLGSGESHLVEGLTGSFSVFGPAAGALIAPDGSIVAVREDGATPSEVIRIARSDGGLKQTLIEAPAAPESRPFRSVDIPTMGGATIQAWISTPAGDGPFPTVLETHGGPQAHETDRFNPAAQGWVDRGYAFLTLNYRGSDGFGQAYEQAIWGMVGRCELDDMVAARDYLVREGIARPGEIIATGGSYGGYLTLLALGRRPDLWAAGVALVAIADWRLMYEDGESLRDYERALFGGPPDELAEIYTEASPITYVGDLRAPLLVIQGRNDGRCPARQMEVYVDQARRLGKPIEIDWFEAGHGHGATETRIAWARRSMEFVDKVLGRA